MRRARGEVEALRDALNKSKPDKERLKTHLNINVSDLHIYLEILRSHISSPAVRSACLLRHPETFQPMELQL